MIYWYSALNYTESFFAKMIYAYIMVLSFAHAQRFRYYKLSWYCLYHKMYQFVAEQKSGECTKNQMYGKRKYVQYAKSRVSLNNASKYSTALMQSLLYDWFMYFTKVKYISISRSCFIILIVIIFLLAWVLLFSKKSEI